MEKQNLSSKHGKYNLVNNVVRQVKQRESHALEDMSKNVPDADILIAAVSVLSQQIQ